MSTPAKHRAHRPMRLVFATMVIAVIGGLGLAVLSVPSTAATSSPPGSSASNPITVSDPSQVPQGAVLTSGPTTNPTTCQTTETWTLTTPGKQEVTQEVYLFTRSHSAVPATPEYEWKQQVPDVFRQGKYKQTTTVYTVEHKEIQGWRFDASKSGHITVGGHTFNGQWVNEHDSNWYTVPDDIVNAAGVNPLTIAHTGIVPLSAYGYTGYPTPNVPYRITSVDISTTPPSGSLFVTNHNVTIYYTGAGNNPSTNPANAVWVNESDAPSGWTEFATQTVTSSSSYHDNGVTAWSDSNTVPPSSPALPSNGRWVYTGTSRDKVGTGSPAWTETYPNGVQIGDYDHYTSQYTPTNLPPANAVTGNPGDTSVPWAVLDEHTKVLQQATPDVTTYYAWNNGATCPAPPPHQPKYVKAVVYHQDKCGKSADMYGAKKSKGVFYTVKGHVIREGVWIKTHGKHRVVVKAHAASSHYKLVGKHKWKLHFSVKACTPPTPPIDTGLY